MDEAKSGPTKRTIVDALVLACSHSSIRDIVGTDALRSVLDVEYRELIADGTFNLQAVWELFEDQPGFDPEKAAAPLCRFKTWERQLGIEISLPSQLRNLSEGEQAKLAGECDVPTVELQKVLRAPSPEEAAAEEAKKKADRARRLSQEIDPDRDAGPPDTRRRLALIGAGIVAVLAFGIAATTLYRGCSPSPDYERFTASLGELPVESPQRFGEQVRATLTDEGWLRTPEKDRRQALESALRPIASKGIQVLYLRDKKGKVRAIAQLYDNDQKIRFVFK